MKIADIRQKTDDELNTELSSLRKEHFNLRFQKSSQQLEKTSGFSKIKKSIARIKTVQNERRKAS